MSDDKDKSVAEGVAHFLYWSGWLDCKDSCYSAALHCDGDITHQCGVKTFKRLEDCLDRNFPEWKSWNPNYKKHLLGDPGSCHLHSQRKPT